jgi:NSS family neurotransmitter:Na+ symporter
LASLRAIIDRKHEYKQTTLADRESKMQASGKTSQQHWSSYYGFMLACIGAAVGLGNIWKFPYMVGANGGSAFVLIYVITVLAIAIPVAAAEIILGRLGQSGPVESLHVIARQENKPTWFGIGGDVGVLASYLLLSFYSVIAGWVMSYLYRAAAGRFSDLDNEASSGLFNQLLADPGEMIAAQFLFVALIALVLTRGIAQGLERANGIMMPALFIMLLGIAAYGFVAGDASAALTYLLTPDFSKITSETILAAVGQGFFSVGVGSAILITYGAYMDRSIKIGTAALTIGIADTLIAFIAGFGIFAIVFGQGLDPASGPGLIFITLPVAFAAIPAGYILAIVFFILVFFAAFSSGLALAEVTIAWAAQRLGLSRGKATALILISNTALGLLTVFSFNILADYRLGDTPVLANRTLFDLKDYLASSILMPVSGLLVILFACWSISPARLEDAFGNARMMFVIWLWLGRIVAPLGIIWVFATSL